jgi:hypothetical protein
MGENLKDHPVVKKVRDRLRVTKVVCTRSVKGKFGDHYVGFSAAWDSMQDDAGGGADLLSAQGEGETKIAVAQTGLSLKEAKVASLMLGMQADCAAHDHAMAGSNITVEQRESALRAIRNNYTKLIAETLGVTNEE